MTPIIAYNVDVIHAHSAEVMSAHHIRKREERLFHAYSMIMTNYLHYIIQVHVLTVSKHLNGRE